jgi:Tfp pilus assembly protein PilX
MNTFRRQRWSGFVLIELMSVIVLLGVFMLVSARLFTSLMRQVRDTTAAQDHSRAFDAAISRLRADVWSANHVQSDGTTVILTRPDRVTTWFCDAGAGTISRTEISLTGSVSAQQRWSDLPARLTFALEGSSLSVRVDERHGGSDTIVMAGEAVLLKGAAE